MTVSPPLGLRDKKRAETRANLERAAVELVARDGLAAATVDAISEAADVSSRTFFNYFDSKEDAILGLRDAVLTEEVVALHIARYDGADLVESIMKLVFGVIGPTIANSDLHAMRMEIVQAHPELLGRHIAQFTRMAGQMTAAIQTLVRADKTFASDVESAADADLAASAELLLALCSGAARVVIKEWVAAGSTADPEQIETRAISLVREVTKKIQ
ncbi:MULTISPECIES: TetR/AcrR family transcriptional regulator [Subtercola]|uniref:TetR family transcriptional regulator n=1 Tax=Subtercola vilae TaxID=2056433 RepID=A0A4T2BUJ7_9MICO|nr:MULTISPECIES: TetR/AcrR family transcriptional regulator [Subtercola]MEA9985529.1 TetR/AcrR family transcriptional regulator [Subtercola sp. RTI3]TIH35147.1 TetR family transcriptional regulator [Subtercola vilae]